jgi:hypothetical protein
MNTLLNRIFQHPLQSALRLACVTAVLAGCGGGGGGSSSTTSFAYGPISGFGSIIVNGVRFDDSSSSVSSEDDDDSQTHRSSSDLKLGMVVAIQGGLISSDDSGHHSRAGEIRFGSELVGPIGPTIALNASSIPLTGQFTVLGQTVNVDSSTIFDDRFGTGFAGLAPGDIVEVHGMLDAKTGNYTATRVEPKAAATQYKIRGVVAALDPNARTFKIGSESISYAADLKLPNSFAKDQIVRVKLQTTQVNNAWIATRIKSGVNSMGDHTEAEVKGTVKDFSPTSKTFTVSGISVDASKASIYPSSLDNGAFVEVEGTMVNNTLIARKVALEDSISEGTGDFEFHGRISNLNPAHTSFEVHSVTVTVTNTTEFARTTKDDLAANMCVEVKTDAAMNATYIKADNDCAP